jgi:hypothetical protein
MFPVTRYWCETSYCREGMYEPPSCAHTRHNQGERCAVLLTDYPGIGKICYLTVRTLDLIKVALRSTAH